MSCLSLIRSLCHQLTFSAACITTCVLSAQGIEPAQARFHHFSMSDGLSNSWISDIHQDNKGFIWFATQYGLNRFDGSHFTYYTYDPDDTSSLAANWVLNIAEDGESNLWVSTYSSGLSSYDPKTNKFSRHFYNYQEPFNSVLRNISTTHIDNAGYLWLGTSAIHTQRYDIKNDILTDIAEFNNHDLTDIVEDHHYIWFATDHGIYHYNKLSREITKIDFPVTKVKALSRTGEFLLVGLDHRLLAIAITSNGTFSYADTLVITPSINDIAVDDDKIWLATKEGLFHHSLTLKKTSKFVHDDSNPYSLFEGEVISLEIDQEGNLWIGGQKGLCVLYNDQDKFEYHGYHPQLKHHRGVRGMTSTHDFIWVGADDGLWRYPKYDLNEAPLQILNIPFLYVMVAKNGSIYAGSRNAQGLFKIESNTLSVKNWLPPEKNSDSMNTGSIWFLQEDTSGGIIISASRSLYYLPYDSSQFINLIELLPLMNNETLIHLPLLLDQKNRLWIGTIHGGVTRINWRTPDHPFSKEEIRNYSYNYEDAGSLSNNVVLFIYEGQSGDIWICTDGGINQYDETFDVFKRYSRSNGLIDDKMLAASEDNEGRIWFSTISHGLWVWEPETLSGTYYQESDGIYHDAFLLHAVHKTEEGIMLFANELGVQIFDPDKINPETGEFPPIYLTGLRLNNVKIDVSATGPLIISPEYIKKLNFTHKQNNMAFSYAIPDFNKSNKYTYKYQLIGVSNEWVSIPVLSNISFAKLNPGNYKLTIEACLMARCQQSNPLHIHISGPFWATTWAYLCYLIISGFLLYQFYRFKIQEKLRKQEQYHRDAIHDAKNRFFINITHEFRTPLTLISGPVDRLMKTSGIGEPEIKKTLGGIKENAEHLLELINNVLEISRAESGLMPVNLIATNLPSFIESVIDTFQSYVLTRNINILFINHAADFLAMIDREKLRIIISNLLSNAIKFSDNDTVITIDLDINATDYLISVSDQGRGISKQDLEKIFDRFYRVEGNREEGTGLGLSLVKELTKLLDGKISVSSSPGNNTTFRVSIPLNLNEDDSYIPQTKDNELVLHQGGVAVLKNDVVLLVEDNDNMAQFIREGLENDYMIYRCSNGKQGYRKAIEIVPNLIISDVMMPEMDGYTLCRKIKTHPITDHIPFLLLTARADTQSRLEGMGSGADAYLAKPFNEEELRYIIRNKLQTQRQLIEKISDPDKNLSTQDPHPFIVAFRRIIDENLQDDGLNVDFLCKTLGTSRTQLHRKIKALTGRSTMQLVNEIKLDKAELLLRTSALNISEIAYKCGFSDPAYFAQVFSKQFQCSATEFREKISINS